MSGVNRQGDFSVLEYLKLDKFDAFFYKLERFVAAITGYIKSLILSLGRKIKDIVLAIKDEISDIIRTFAKGNWAVKLSFLVFGFGNIYYGQILRGILFLVFEIVFFVYMLFPTGGLYWIN